MGVAKPLKNNVELHDYLVGLSLNLGQRDLLGPSKQLARVCKLAASNAPEFLGEVRTLLRSLIDNERCLTADERSKATEVLAQLELALRIR